MYGMAPGEGFAQIERLDFNTTVNLQGRNEASTWAYISTLDGTITGWVLASWLTGATIGSLPVVDAQGAVVAAGDNAADAPAESAESANATSQVNLRVRQGPSTSYSRFATLSQGQAVTIEGRNSGATWALISTADGTRGWVSARFLTIQGVSLSALPVSDEIFQTPPSASGGGAAVGNFVSFGTYLGTGQDFMMNRLRSIPELYNMTSGTVYATYQRGRALGNRANVFTKVGDSITETQPFLWDYGAGNYDLGQYGYLQTTIDYFSTTPPRAGQPNSFLNRSFASGSAFNAAAIIDTIWSDPNFCSTTETPLECELRIVKPSVALVMLGSVDIQIYDISLYSQALQSIVQISLNRGVIPVLTTFPISRDYLYWEKSLRFNMIILDVAQHYNIPVINLWKATENMPQNGTAADRFHLSQPPVFYRLTGEEFTYGISARNWLTLRALDTLRANVLR